jgi:phosphoserine phosphatase RsbU/P
MLLLPPRLGFRHLLGAGVSIYSLGCRAPFFGAGGILLQARIGWRTFGYLASAVLLFVLPGLGIVYGQSGFPVLPGHFDATALRGTTDVKGMWLIHGGDDPAWAEPGFDDSGWTPFDPGKQSLHSIFPGGNPGIVWYRLHVKVDPEYSDLGLQESELSNAFSLFANGTKILSLGSVAPYRAYRSGSPLVAALPPEQVKSGSVLIAARVGLSDNDWLNPGPGLYPGNLKLGREVELQSNRWLDGIGKTALFFVNQAVSLALGIAALLLFTAQRKHLEYLWLFLGNVCILLGATNFSIFLFRPLPLVTGRVSGVPAGLYCFFLAMMYLAFVGRRPGWRLTTLIAAATTVAVYADMGSPGIAHFGQVMQAIVLIPWFILTAIALPWILLLHWRRGNREAGILLIPLLLGSGVLIVSWLSYVLSFIALLKPFSTRVSIFMQATKAGPFTIQPTIVCALLTSIALGIIILLRTNRLSRQGAVLEGEMAAAREVQRVILPEQMETLHGFSVESVYLPAQQVGGDFFQVLPANDGGMLVVVGDVAGKGLPAAMLVSVLVGATRTVAAYESDPRKVLAMLNEQLVGRASGGFSTALAAHVSADGQVMIANAGHLSPYLNGVEIELPGALPLGIVSGVDYEAITFELPPDGRLTFYSDGVVEAQNLKGELFGFERARDISRKTADAVAEEAKAFGQSDDITVIAVVRAAVVQAEEFGAIGLQPEMA